MNRRLLVILMIFGMLTSVQEIAAACSCARQTPAEYYAKADRVLLATVGGETQTQKSFNVSFAVLHTFKGKVASNFVWKRGDKNPLCGPEGYTPGQVVILFVKKGDLHLCTGNFNMNEQVKDLGAYLQIAGTKTSPVKLATMKFALENRLKGYLHDRPKVWVSSYPRLKNKSIRIGKSLIRFRSLGKRPLPKSDIHIGDGVRFSSLIYVSGHYRIEGLAFHILFRKKGKQFEVLYSSSSERSGKR